ncbi:uncharacterized protein M6B38_144330 [Iris pallida]|uniref:Uncharacterized protein n=1 Tax=Iris pallida TaxID=29817 RepID=A0AAX6FB95_IRIPA|nr:uncharacterized protein M6B38_144330 [Iris pallida]
MGPEEEPLGGVARPLLKIGGAGDGFSRERLDGSVAAEFAGRTLGGKRRSAGGTCSPRTEGGDLPEERSPDPSESGANRSRTSLEPRTPRRSSTIGWSTGRTSTSLTSM